MVSRNGCFLGGGGALRLATLIELPQGEAHAVDALRPGPRLHQVGIGEPQVVSSRLRGPRGREDAHRDSTQACIALDRREYFVAVQAGEVEVQQHQVWPGGHLEGLLPE